MTTDEMNKAEECTADTAATGSEVTSEAAESAPMSDELLEQEAKKKLIAGDKERLRMIDDLVEKLMSLGVSDIIVLTEVNTEEGLQQRLTYETNHVNHNDEYVKSDYMVGLTLNLCNHFREQQRNIAEHFRMTTVPGAAMERFLAENHQMRQQLGFDMKENILNPDGTLKGKGTKKPAVKGKKISLN